MRFEWDERKRQANLAKRGLDFRRAVEVFDRSNFTYSSARRDEVRWVTIGVAHGRWLQSFGRVDLMRSA